MRFVDEKQTAPFGAVELFVAFLPSFKPSDTTSEDTAPVRMSVSAVQTVVVTWPAVEPPTAAPITPEEQVPEVVGTGPPEVTRPLRPFEFVCWL